MGWSGERVLFTTGHEGAEKGLLSFNEECGDVGRGLACA